MGDQVSAPPVVLKSQNCHHFNGKTRDKAAAYFGVSGRHLEKIGAVCESEFPELVEELDAEPRSVHRCYQKLKLLRNQQAALDEEIEPVQVGRYRLRENEIIVRREACDWNGRTT